MRWVMVTGTIVFSAVALLGIDFCRSNQSSVSRRLSTPLIVRDSQNPVAARRHCATPPHRPHVLVACSLHFQSLPAPLHRCSTLLLLVRRRPLTCAPLASVDLSGSDAICGSDAISPLRVSPLSARPNWVSPFPHSQSPPPARPNWVTPWYHLKHRRLQPQASPATHPCSHSSASCAMPSAVHLRRRAPAPGLHSRLWSAASTLAVPPLPS
ncbi:hypothetical protein U1Q18_034275 [Sarracenia purpurea var. burkii]